MKLSQRTWCIIGIVYFNLLLSATIALFVLVVIKEESRELVFLFLLGLCVANIGNYIESKYKN